MGEQMGDNYMQNMDGYDKNGNYGDMKTENYDGGVNETNIQNDSNYNDNTNYNNDSSYTEIANQYQTIEEIVARTGYSFDKTQGQHKYGGPPPNYTGEEPGSGHEIYVGKIPQEIMEDQLIPLFEEVGTLYELRLMMDPTTDRSKGFCFITYIDKAHAKKAAEMYNNFEIRHRKRLKVNLHKPNTRLYVANIPKNKDKAMIFTEVSLHLEGLRDVIIYNIPDDPKKKNRGFAFLDFKAHKFASEAKKKLNSNHVRFFNIEVIADWADPQDEPDDDIMSKVKVLYIRNLKMDITEEDLFRIFSPYGKLEKVKRVKDYGFVHYEQREDAMRALETQHNQMVKDSHMNITLAKPPIDPKLKEQRKQQHAIMLSKNQGARGGYAGKQNNWTNHTYAPADQYPRIARGGSYNNNNNDFNQNFNNNFTNNNTPTEYYDNNTYDYYDQSNYNSGGYEEYDQSEYNQDNTYNDYNYDDYYEEEQEEYQQPYQPTYIPRPPPFKSTQPPPMRGVVRGGPQRGRGMQRGGVVGGGMVGNRGGSMGRGMGGGMMRGAGNRGIGGGMSAHAGVMSRGGGMGVPAPGGGGGGMNRGGVLRGVRGMQGVRGGFTSPPRGGVRGSGVGGFRGGNAPNGGMGGGGFRGRGGLAPSRGGGNNMRNNLKRKAPDNYTYDNKQPRMTNNPPPQQQQQRYGGQQQTNNNNQGDGWTTQPIVQKPLNQMSNCQEQWF